MKRLLRHAAHTLTAFLSLSLLTHATVAAQALSTAGGPGTSVALGGGPTVFQADYGRRILGGGLIFADIHPHWRFGLEAEARFLRLHTTEQVTETNFLLGPRVLLLPPARWQPYAKFLVGDGHINLPFGYARGDFLALVPGAGLDIALNSTVTIRALDVEYQLWRDFPYGNLRPYGVSTGLSLRLNPIHRFPNGPRLRRH
ncbi:MAG TPA: hypothetical protein VM865_10495 [Acidobacteriaceae bacterium]|jgi:hypothetical protein|nr:hypothetical protein [Acidobacteriaceae bacterium]